MPPLHLPPDPPSDERQDTKGITVRFTIEEKAKIQTVADLWNATDKALSVRRKRRWELSSIVREATGRLLEAVEEEIGSFPLDVSDIERAKWIERAVASLRRAAKAHEKARAEK